jgi:hypothetical protein
MSVLEGTSAALTRKDEVHRLATVNRSVRSQCWRFFVDTAFTQVESADEIVPSNMTLLIYCSHPLSDDTPFDVCVGWAKLGPMSCF